LILNSKQSESAVEKFRKCKKLTREMVFGNVKASFNLFFNQILYKYIAEFLNCEKVKYDPHPFMLVPPTPGRETPCHILLAISKCL
jgi:hypothetical protein